MKRISSRVDWALPGICFMIVLFDENVMTSHLGQIGLDTGNCAKSMPYSYMHSLHVPFSCSFVKQIRHGMQAITFSKGISSEYVRLSVG